MYGHIVFSGPNRTMKLFYKDSRGAQNAELRHTLVAHDVGVADGTLSDAFGSRCKCPPGTYKADFPLVCATRLSNGGIQVNHDDDRAYGCFFTPLEDLTPDGPFAQHGRSGIGIHGGGSDLPDPFAMSQGWEWTYGCIRLQNIDNETIFVPFVKFILSHSGEIDVTVDWSS